MKNSRPISIPCLTIIISLFSICGCGKSLQKKVTGKWAIDQEDNLFEMMGDEESASDDLPKFTLEFSNAGVFRSSVTSSGHTQSKEGRWFFVKGEADLCWLKVAINSDNPEIEPDIVLTEVKFLDESTIELVPPNMDVIKQKMVFRKMK